MASRWTSTFSPVTFGNTAAGPGAIAWKRDQRFNGRRVESPRAERRRAIAAAKAFAVALKAGDE